MARGLSLNLRLPGFEDVMDVAHWGVDQTS